MVVAVNATGLAAVRAELLGMCSQALHALLAGVAAESAHRRPIRHRWRRRDVEAREVPRTIDDPAADNRQLGDGIGNFALGAGEIVAIRNDQVGELADLNASLLPLFVGEPGDVLGPKTQRRLAVEAVALWIDAQAPTVRPVTSQASDTHGL